MLTKTLTQTWKAAAAAQFQPNAAEIEKAFGDQAFAQLQQAAGPLLQAPYLIGFEVVESNYPENTRLVGVHAFKIDKEILLVPAMFINGSIKGQELLYEEKSKLFKPLTLEWAQYQVSKINRGSEGQAVSRSTSAKNPAQVHLYRLDGPPGGFKIASADRDRVIKAAKEMMERARSMPSLDTIPDVATDFFNLVGAKVASSLLEISESEFSVKDAFYGTGFDERLKEIVSTYKEASTEEKPKLRVIKSAKLSQVPADQRSAYIRDGFYVEDSRPDYDKNDLLHVSKDASQVRIVSQDYGLENLTKGYYDAIVTGLGTAKVLVVPEQLCNCDTHLLTGAQVTVIDEEGRCEREVRSEKVMGEKLVLEDEIPDSLRSKPITELPDREIRAVITVGGIAALAGTVRPVKDLRGLRVVEVGVNQYHVINTQVKSSLSPEPRQFYHGPVSQYRTNDSTTPVLGYDAQFIEVKEFDTLGLASPEEVNQAVNKGSPFVRGEVVLRAPNEYMFSWDSNWLSGESNRRSTITGNKEASVAYLTGTCGVDGKSAQELMSTVTNTPVELILSVKDAAAYNATTLAYDPIWTQNYDGRVNVTTQEPQGFIVPSYSERTPPPKPRLGDSWDPAMGRSMILSAEPTELFQFAQENGIPKLLDHGAVGTLAKMFDAGSIVETIIPKLEQALDAIGRVYFLILWKPEDFKTLYGDADMRDKESTFLSCFRQLGSLVLDLAKRSQDYGAAAGNPDKSEQEN